MTSGDLPQKDYARIIARAWADEAFKARLLQDPVSVLKEHGVDVSDDVEVRVLENTDQVIHFVLPARTQDELNEEQLEKVAGGLDPLRHAGDSCFA